MRFPPKKGQAASGGLRGLGVQIVFSLFVAGLAQQGEHVGFIGLHPGLIKGVYPGEIAGQAAGILKEVDQLAGPVGGALWNGEQEVGHASGDVGQHGALPGLLVDEPKVPPPKVPQA